MVSFSDFSTWGVFNTIAILLIALIVAHFLKEIIPPLKKSLIPTSVLGGIMLLIITTTYHAITDNVLFDTSFFGGKGSSVMEIVTYHSLALGFIASTLKKSEKKFDKKRNGEIFNTGLTTVSSYLMQGFLGLIVTLIFAGSIKLFAGVLLPFGYGQGTGQAMNYGSIFEKEHGLAGGAHFGLTIAGLGFLSACIGGVIYLNILRKKGKISIKLGQNENNLFKDKIQDDNEIPFDGSMDKMTVQLALVGLVYIVSFAVMYLLGSLFGEGIRLTIFGLNFLFGVLFAVLTKTLIGLLSKKKIIKRQYTNNFLLTRISNCFFDIMIVAGISVIRLDYIKDYWLVLIVLGLVGATSTYFYNKFVSKKLFPEYANEQFLVMYGMLTGTASTGVILLRELDGEFKSPANENLIYQNLPAIVFGFPMMFLVLLAPTNPYLTLGILFACFVFINVLLFRKFIFKGKAKQIKE